MIKFVCSIFFLLLTTSLLPAQITGCKALPVFLKNRGFVADKTFFSTVEKNITGIKAIMSERPGDHEAEVYKTFQHESWTKGGNLGPILTDKKGDTYVLPAPKVTTLLNPPEKQNTIYQIANETGIMDEWLTLPTQKLPDSKNPYGLMGIAYDCNSELLYVSTISGSDEKYETGRIYKINQKNKSYSVIADSIDIFGLGFHNSGNKRYLYMGSASTQNMLLIEMDENGNPLSLPQVIFNIKGLGLRGDDKIKKIRFVNETTMIIQITPFYYNLAAPGESQVNEATLIWNGTNWVLKSLK